MKAECRPLFLLDLERRCTLWSPALGCTLYLKYDCRGTPATGVTPSESVMSRLHSSISQKYEQSPVRSCSMPPLQADDITWMTCLSLGSESAAGTAYKRYLRLVALCKPKGDGYQDRRRLTSAALVGCLPSRRRLLRKLGEGTELTQRLRIRSPHVRPSFSPA